MFKLLKELTKAPERLAGTSSQGSPYENSPHLQQHHYVPRQCNLSPAGGRSRSPTLEGAAADAGRKAVGLQNELRADQKEVEVKESDPDAIRIAEQLKELERLEQGNQVMHLVEVSFFYSLWLIVCWMLRACSLSHRSFQSRATKHPDWPFGDIAVSRRC